MTTANKGGRTNMPTTFMYNEPTDMIKKVKVPVNSITAIRIVIYLALLMNFTI